MKNRIWRILTVTLTLCLAFSLAACRQNNAAVKGGFTPGLSANNEYFSTFFGLTCTLDDAWNMFDDAALKEKNQNTLSSLQGDYETAIKEAQFFTDLYAMNDENGDVLEIRVENLPTMYDQNPSEEEYMDILMSSLAGADPETVTGERVTVSVAGVSHPALKVTLDTGDYQYYDLSVPIREGDRMAIISVSTPEADRTNDILSTFSAL